MQYVMMFKCLKFDDNWSNLQPVQLPQGAAYTAGKEGAGLRVVVEFEPGKVQTYTFKVPPNEIVGVSVPENLVFIPKIKTAPDVSLGVQL